GTRDLDKLGGLARSMPITFFAFLIAALSISGVPPLNGFFSKWMVYQGVIEAGKEVSALWVVCLVAAVFGSALTLASFAKLTHAIFLGSAKTQERQVTESPLPMWLPPALLAVLCIAFGIFAVPLPLRRLIYPAVSETVVYPGVWNPTLATLLIIAGIVVGSFIYLFGAIRSVRVEQPYLGGEVMPPETSPSGVDFYQTVRDLPALKPLYRLAERKVFDIYDEGIKLSFGFSGLLRRLHTGALPMYVSWCLVGLLILLFIILKV
ncbi:MAG: proton-conducting transporter membrane subunit, partial [bacterium]|nr:proton-conducting transporter membrane subunit [bacterium]